MAVFVRYICNRLRSLHVLSAGILRLFLPFLVLLHIPVFATAETDTPVPAIEFRVKAAFLYNFSRYVEWSNSSLVHHQVTTFNICTIGNKEIYSSLQEYSGKKIRERPISIVEHNANTQNRSLNICDVLYIQNNFTISREKLEEAERSGVLTVSDQPQFAIINFLIVNEKIRFEILKEKAEKANLSISSHLLRLAIQR